MAAIALHDSVQATAALLLGDRTAKAEGRLTLSPVPHLSVLGLLAVLFGPFGWSKPVPVDHAKLNGDRRFNATLVYASGMFANVAAGIVLWWMFFAVSFSALAETFPGWSADLILGILQWSYIFNTMLAIIHLLPLFPMDGWKIVRVWLPERWKPALDKYEKLGTAVLVGIVVTPFGQWLLHRLFDAANAMIMNLYSLG